MRPYLGKEIALSPLIRVVGMMVCALVAVAAPSPTGAAKWTASDGFQAPESAYFDPKTDLLYVSNVAGLPHEKDGKGWIQKLTASGKVVAAEWVKGLNAPKGMRAFGDVLWVADIDEIVAIDMKRGSILQKITPPGARLLNDVATAEDGTVFVSDTFGGKIYSLDTRGNVSVLAEGADLESPNGLLVDGNELLVAGWGTGTKEDWSTEKPGRLFALNIKTKKRRLITAEPLGNLDGLEKDGRGNYLVSDWVAGKIYRVSKKGKAELLMEGLKGPADVGYHSGKRLLVVPRMMENLVAGYSLK